MSKRRKPRLLFYSDVFDPLTGGLVTSMKRILAGLSRSGGYDVHLLTYDPRRAERGPARHPDGYAVHGHGCGERQIAYLYLQSAMKAMVDLQRRYDFDLMVAFFAHMPLFVVGTVAQAFDVPYIVCARGSDIHVNMQKGLHRKFMRAYFRGAAGVVCVSDAMARLVRRWKLAPREHVVMTVSNAVDLESFRAYHALKEARSPRYDFLFAGNARPVKRFDLVLDALGRLKENGISPRLAAVLVPHRRHEDLIEVYRRETEERGLTSTVRYLRPLPASKFRRLYAQSKCVLVASDSEGCSNMILEGMASGCSIIARDRCMPRHLLNASNRVFSSAGELADRMGEVLTSPEQFVEENVRCVERHHSLAAEVDAYRSIFDDVLSSRRRRIPRCRKEGRR